jgi:hypothetical protein
VVEEVVMLMVEEGVLEDIEIHTQQKHLVVEEAVKQV